ncbi:MAG: hypothetical protein KIT84_30115 [Labilithrix sp.]|nr:hypothetical protein [Labilithrix sp.]MCW5815320.1 hypothetical protein [Labilithrix sp.]
MPEHVDDEPHTDASPPDDEPDDEEDEEELEEEDVEEEDEPVEEELDPDAAPEEEDEDVAPELLLLDVVDAPASPVSSASCSSSSGSFVGGFVFGIFLLDEGSTSGVSSMGSAGRSPIIGSASGESAHPNTARPTNAAAKRVPPCFMASRIAHEMSGAVGFFTTL